MSAKGRLGLAALVWVALVRPSLGQALVQGATTPAATPEPTPPPTSVVERHGEIQVATSVSPSPVTVGDRVAYTVVIDAPGAYAVSAPELTATADAFEVAAPFALVGESVLSDRVVRTYLASLAPFETGVRMTPAGEVLVRHADTEQTIPLPAIGVVVRSVLPPGTPPPLRGAKGVFGLPNWLPSWLLLVLAGVVVAAAVAWILARRGRPPPLAAAPPPLPYDESARRELEGLVNGPFAAPGRHKEFFVRFSEIVRTYLGEHHRFDAMEMTSDELKRTLKEKGIGTEDRGLSWPLFDLSDLTKFARYVPSSADRDDAVARARKLFARPRRELAVGPPAALRRTA